MYNYRPGNTQRKIAYIEKTWKRVIPEVGFDYWFLKEEFDRMYKTEKTVSSLVKSFTVLALIITVLGLYGLASYTAEQRTKEVGIRKVMGATSLQVVLMILYSFMKIFFIATLIAVPVAWYFADNWLSTFVYRTPLDVLVFVITIAGLMVLTFVTVSYEIYRAAIANPVNALKHE
jgi:putative ABC transport system permease protein